ncbi:myeloid protein 1-like isoform X2 [Takifugu flavidus]|uniref:myeloid protein 1-like isoform X2 n=1 Tax=Takifugu flavidus TaxID=433684 RepID=UPI002544BE21|nr:myeloid protein 1-like isoform X2 [Takifugu flavidus]
MKTTWRIGLITAVCLCYVLKTCAAHPDERASEDQQRHYIRPKAAAWSVLCDSHHHNCLRGCGGFSCGEFNPKRGNDQHRTVDLACDHNSVVKAPFSGSLAGPVSHSHSDGSHHHGVTLLNDEHCVHIFNIQALRSTGRVTQGEPLGQMIPQQKSSGSSPRLKLQMCDGSDPSPFLGL